MRERKGKLRELRGRPDLPRETVGNDADLAGLRRVPGIEPNASAEHLLQQRLSTQTKVFGHVGENPRESTHSQTIVVRNCDMVLAVTRRSQPDMRAFLTRDHVSDPFESLDQIGPG